MKKTSLLPFTFLLLASTAKTQLIDVTITPGIGIGKLKLGMSEKQVLQILGGEPTWAGYKTTMQSYKESTADNSFAIDSMLIYVQGFDTMAKYENGTANTPIMNLFFYAHRLNYIALSSYVVEKNIAKKVKLNNGIKFYDKLNAVKNKMKTKSLAVRFGTMTADLVYYKEGVEKLFDEDALTFITIFPKSPKFLQTMKTNKDRLIKAYGNLQKAME
jgi:hypothetical protein